MPVPATINDLSIAEGSNSPPGGEPPSGGDNYLRALSAFIAQLRDMLNGTSGAPTTLSLTVTNATTLNGSLTVAGATALNGNTTIGNAAGDALTVNPNAITLANTPTIMGAATWASAQTFSADPAGRVLGSTYTPTLTNGAEVTSSTPSVLQYGRVGPFAFVAGQVSVTTSSNIGNLFSLGISLPVASAFTSAIQLGGSGADVGTQTTVRPVDFIADVTNDRALMRGRVTVGATPFTYSFFFAYQVL